MFTVGFVLNMLPDSLRQLILSYKYNIERHEQHVELMLELLRFHFVKLFRVICLRLLRPDGVFTL